MKSFLRSRAGELAISFLSYLVCYFPFTIVADDYGYLGFSMAGRQFNDYCHMNYYYLGFVYPLGRAIQILCDLWPAWNVVGILFVVFQFWGLYLFLRSIKNVILKDIPNLYLIRIVQCLFTLFFIENIVSLSYVRFSLILCGISLFNLAFIKEIRKRDFLLNGLIFILGILIRPESGVGMLVVVSVGYLIYSFNIWHLVKRFILPASIAITMLTLFAIDWSHTNIYVRKLEPEIEYKIMDRRYVSISEMKSAADSVKYELAINGMWFDTKVITIDFLRSILLPGMNTKPAHSVTVFFHLLSFYKYYLFVPFFIIAMIFCSFFQTDRWRLLLRITLFEIFIFALQYASDYNGLLLAERHFLNIELISMLIIIFYFFNSAQPFYFLKANKYTFTISLLFVMTGGVMTLFNYKQVNTESAKEIVSNETIMRKIETQYSHKIIVFTNTGIHLVARKFSLKNDNYSNNTYILYDFLYYSLLPEYVEYLNRECKCNPSDPVTFFEWLASQKALYLAEPFRYDLTEKYMHTIYNKRVKFTSPINLNKLSNCDDFVTKDYELRDVLIEN